LAPVFQDLTETAAAERGQEMALTRSFKELVQKRVASDPAFGKALLREGIDTMLAGDVDTGKAILAHAPTRRPATSSASSATCRNRPASSSTSRGGVDGERS
jgi:hypothetical protein